MAIPETSGISDAVTRLRDLLDRARQIKPTTNIIPPLPSSAFQGASGIPSLPGSTTHPFAVEYAARQILQSRTASTPINDPGFIEVWDLLDILNICSDQDQCEPSLVWWLIEELLETQSIDACRVVFDYLESRRERLIAKFFERRKDIVILRAFNGLLRRLSRAEEAVFCGRIFLFLFQTFPLGAKSSSNIKGDFHKENLTVFEETVDLKTEEPSSLETEEPPSGDAMSGVETQEMDAASTTTTKPLSSADELYPAFWTMQQAFSNPPDFFSIKKRVEEFKASLEATLAKFKEVPKVNQAAADNKRGMKRKVGDINDEFATNFNPKYLTSRELFTLELSDLAFQRHILVQALILLDFLLSLTDENKQKSAGVSKQRTLTFDFTLSEKDAEWGEKTRRAISSYLTDGQLSGDQEGKYYHRMVETVLSRDKNWVRWKLETCQEIKKLPVYSGDFGSARDGAKRICKTTALKSAPMGGLDLRFLTKSGSGESFETLSGHARPTLPDAETLVKEVESVDLDLEMADTSAEKQTLQDAKSSKTWRALRLMSKTKLSLFDGVDDGRNLRCFVQLHGTATANIQRGEMTVDGGDVSSDARPEEGTVG